MSSISDGWCSMHPRSPLHTYTSDPSSGASWARHKGVSAWHQPRALAPAASSAAGQWRTPTLTLAHTRCCRGYINLYSLYIAWLASAIFIHMPSLESLGLDVRADVSTLLVTFVVTLGVLGVLHGARTHTPCSATHNNALPDEG